MIDEATAVEYARRFLAANRLEVGDLDAARFIPEEQTWACVFANKPRLDGAVDAPGVTIVDVNSESGQASLFDSL
jgi:hypothetical protein